MTSLYPFDPSGTAITNRVGSPNPETHTITATQGPNINYIVPLAAPFFKAGLIVKKIHAGLETTLVEGVDYLLTHRFIGATRSLGKPVYGSISIIDSSLNATIALTYQTLGGTWVLDDNGIVRQLTDLLYNPRTISWDQVSNMPTAFPPGPHSQDINDFKGTDELVDELENIKQAIIDSTNDPNNLTQLLLSHINSPSSHSKSQVGLGLVQNYAPSTSLDNQQGVANNKYMTPADTVELMSHFNSASADKLKEPIKITIDGVVKAEAMFDGSGDIVLTTIGASGNAEVRAPKAVSPIQGSTNQSTNIQLSATSYAAVYNTDDRFFREFELTLDTDFGFIAPIFTTQVNSDSVLVPMILSINTAYRWRCRDRSSTGYISDWMETTTFTTSGSGIGTPSIISPLNNATGTQRDLGIAGSNFIVVSGSDGHLNSDWQFSRSSDFGIIVHESLADSANKTAYPVPLGILDPGTTYYVRVRYRGFSGSVSSYSNIVTFTTLRTIQPSITSPLNGQTNFPLIGPMVAEAFASTGSDVHFASEWQIAIASDFLTLAYSFFNTSTNKVSLNIPEGALNQLQAYFVRVRYVGSNGGNSEWSLPINFITGVPVAIEKPTIISPTNNQAPFSKIGPFTSSAFALTSGIATHVSTDWQISAFPNFVSLIYQSINDTVNKTSLQIMPDVLMNLTEYYVRVRYDGETTTSQWSDPARFVTGTAAGVTWTPVISNTTQYLHDVVFGNGLFVAMGAGSTNYVTSPDGVTWTARNTGISHGAIRNMIFANGRFVAVAGGAVITSTDGIIWSGVGVNPSSGDLWGIAYGNGLYVVSSVTNGKIFTSPDLTTWTERVSNTTDSLVSIVYENNLFVVVGNSGRIITSPNGITWTTRTSGVGYSLRDIFFKDGLYMVTGHNGSSVLVSNNGIDWVPRNLSFSGGFMYFGTTGNGLFVVGGDNGRLETSPDSINWTVRATGVTDTIHGIAYEPTLDRFVAVGNNGRILVS